MNDPNGIKSYLGFRRRVAPGDEAQQMPASTLSDQKLIVLLLVSVLFSIAFSFVLSRQSVVLIRSDHFSRWYATHKMVTEGRSLYDPRNGEEVVAFNSIPFDPIEGSFFYPAYLIVFTLPLAWLPYPLAHFIWLTLIQFFLIASIWLIFRELKWPDSINQFTLFLFLSIFFIPNTQNTIWGQFNTIAVLSLALVYVFLRRRRYLVAGLMAAGMLFKPQQMLLTLLFLLLWALFRRERWRVLAGFGIGSLALFLVAFVFEPDWISGFIRGVRGYSGYHNPQSVISLLGIPGWIFFGILAALSVWLFVRNLASPPQSIPFAGCIILSLGIWWLFVPVLGMMHLVALPIAMLFLFASLKGYNARLYRYAIAAFLILYGLGLAGFLYGLSSPDLYGIHIRLSEFAYKLAAPALLVVLALPLGFSNE